MGVASDGSHDPFGVSSRSAGTLNDARMKRGGWFIAVIAGTALLALWLWQEGQEARAIRHLPALERHALYDRTLRTLRSPCKPGDDSKGLTEFCAAQAKFVLEFPECDAACVSLAKQYLQIPVK